MPGSDAALHKAQTGGLVWHAGPRALLPPDGVRLPALHLPAAGLLLLVIHLVVTPVAHIL